MYKMTYQTKDKVISVKSDQDLAEAYEWAFEHNDSWVQF